MVCLTAMSTKETTNEGRWVGSSGDVRSVATLNWVVQESLSKSSHVSKILKIFSYITIALSYITKLNIIS